MFKVNGQRVRQELFKRGVSLKDFAKNLGLNQLTVKKILRGEKVQSKVVSALAKSFGVDAEQLIVL